MMSRSGENNFRNIDRIIAAVALLGCGLAMQAQQFPTQAAKPDAPPPLRATAVLEYLGPLDKPTASRLLPVAVFDGEGYQPGGLYLAQPAPLAVQAGTEYELEQAGTPKGLYAVNAAEKLNGDWIGIGRWEPLIAAAKPKLHVSRTPPKVVKDVDPNRPHFAGKQPREESETGPTSAGQAKPPHTTTDTKTDTTSKTAAPPVDPERPTLRRRPESSKPTKDSVAPGSPVTATADIDPDRPRLRRGVPANIETIDQPSKLEGNPANMQQVVAISDARKSGPHQWAYSWADPGDAQKAQAALEGIAQKLIAPAAAKPATNEKPPRRSKSEVKPPVPVPTLSNEVFKAYELTYGGGSTLVFTAQSGDGGPHTKYVTLIAQPDFYGNPRVLFQQVTRGDQLDVTPQMKLVDAADTTGDNRADLIFELKSATDRQFAIYRVANGEADRVFTSSTMP